MGTPFMMLQKIWDKKNGSKHIHGIDVFNIYMDMGGGVDLVHIYIF